MFSVTTNNEAFFMKSIMNDTQWFDKIRIYHIFLDRFNGGWSIPPVSVNDFCGGNLRGVIDKLDDIKSLGFNAIMLSPFYKTASYHGYHTQSFDEVDPHFGTWEDFQKLVSKAHETGLRVVCDFVPNHCSCWNPIFQAALIKNGGVNRDWFFFPNEGSDDYVSFLNLPELPKINLTNREAARYVILKAIKLAKMGVDGFRIDHALGQPFSFLKSLRLSLKHVRNDIVVFGEVWAEGISKGQFNQLYFKTPERKEHYLSAYDSVRNQNVGNNGINQEEIQLDYVDVLDGVLDFAYRDIMIEEVRSGRGVKGNPLLRRKLTEHFRQYPYDFKLVLFLDNHDTNRFLFECNQDVTLFAEAIDFTNNLRRPFSVLYGTEQLMTNQTSIMGAEPYADLRVRHCMDWGREPFNILSAPTNHYAQLPTINTNVMPIANGTEWSSVDHTLNPETSNNDVQPRKVTDMNQVVWRSVETKWNIASLILQKSKRAQLEEIAAYINQKDLYATQWGINRFLRGESCICVNFYGPSGTGKSIGAEALANACGRMVIKASYSQIQSDRWGGTENNLTSLFEEARKTGAVIILNEADGLFSKRRSEGANSETNNQIKCHLLDLMDNYEVVLVLTTNRFEDYDDAFYRRTMFQIEFPLPGQDELVQLWKMHLGCSADVDKRFSEGGEIPKSNTFSFETVAAISQGLSGGDIRRITLGAMGKILASPNPLLTEELLNGLIAEYKQTRKHPTQGYPHVPVGQVKEDILNIVHQKD